MEGYVTSSEPLVPAMPETTPGIVSYITVMFPSLLKPPRAGFLLATSRVLNG